VAFEFHYRFNDDGACDVICTRCFRNVGHAQGPEAMRRLTASHACERSEERPLAAASASRNKLSESLDGLAHQLRLAASPIHFLAIITVLLFYALPTLLEMHISHNPREWLACILVGDLGGCMGIYFILKRHRTAVMLYSVLTVVESSAYCLQIVSMQSLAWVMDVIPTLVLISQIAQLKLRADSSQAM
jgi:hypothetical protein